MTGEPTREELSEACNSLVRLWHTRSAISPDRKIDRYHDARLHTVSALAAHAYRVGEVGNHLIGEGLWLESAPLIRTSYECSITAMWTALVSDGTEALLNEDFRSRRLMAETMKRVESWTAAGLTVPDSTDDDHQTLSGAQARNFLQMCDDLTPGGAEAYALYRAMCWFSHPTNYVIDNYADLVLEGDEIQDVTLRRTPKPSDENAHLFQFVCAASMVTAAAALNVLDADKTHVSLIATLADRIGVTADVRLTDRARARVTPTP